MRGQLGQQPRAGSPRDFLDLGVVLLQDLAIPDRGHVLARAEVPLPARSTHRDVFVNLFLSQYPPHGRASGPAASWHPVSRVPRCRAEAASGIGNTPLAPAQTEATARGL